MAATTTTLDGAVSAQATTVKLTAYTNPSHPYGTPIMLLVGGTEQMRMLSVAGRVLSVMRGQAGTSALAHATGATVSYGASQDIAGLGSDVGVTQPAALVDSASVTWDTSVPGQVTAAAAGGGTPGGADTQVQFNDSGTFGGSVNLTWDGSKFHNKLAQYMGPAEADLPASLQGWTGGYHLTTVTAPVSGTGVGVEVSGDNAIGFFAVSYGSSGLPNEGPIGIAGTAIVTTASTSGYNFYGASSTLGVTASALYNFYAAPAVGVSSDVLYQFYAGHVGGSATNAYPYWFNEQGVKRGKADNTFDGVYQVIDALYNPRFTQYIAGAADYERIVEQWETDVATIRTENGGTGTLRALKVAAGTSSIKINANSTIQMTGTVAAPVIVLPTADPHVVGALWNNAGTLTISAG